MFAGHTFEPMLVLKTVLHHDFMMRTCGIRATGTFCRTFASAVFRPIKLQRDLFDEKLSITRNKREHAAGETQIQLSRAGSVFVAALFAFFPAQRCKQFTTAQNISFH